MRLIPKLPVTIINLLYFWLTNSFLEFYLPFFIDKIIVFVLALTEWLRPVSFGI